MIYCNHDIGLPQISYFGNSFLGMSKPKKQANLSMKTLIKNLAKLYNEPPLSNIVCFEAELIDRPKDFVVRDAIDSVVCATVWDKDYGMKGLRIGTFDQAGGHRFRSYHPDHPKYLNTLHAFRNVAKIGGSSFVPLYLNDSKGRRITLAREMPIEHFKGIVAGRRMLVESVYSDYIMSIHHTTMRNFGPLTISKSEQEELYIGDDLWRVLCQSAGGDALWWIPGTMKDTIPERALAIAKEVMEETK